MPVKAKPPEMVAPKFFNMREVLTIGRSIPTLPSIAARCSSTIPPPSYDALASKMLWRSQPGSPGQHRNRSSQDSDGSVALSIGGSVGADHAEDDNLTARISRYDTKDGSRPPMGLLLSAVAPNRVTIRKRNA